MMMESSIVSVDQNRLLYKTESVIEETKWGDNQFPYFSNMDAYH